MLKKLRAIIVGGLALCCLYLFALYLRTDGGELIKNTVSLADDAQETACPTEAAAATETPVQSAAPYTLNSQTRFQIRCCLALSTLHRYRGI